tara:strand:+ start:171 stop:941 length:771 start_codon:yes stop_codon:yes gene_type:complete
MVNYLDYEQGSIEWLEARGGLTTASMFTVCRGITGGMTDQQRVYVDLVMSGSDPKDAAPLAGYKTKPSGAGIAKALAGEKVGEYSQKTKNYAFRLAVERISGELLSNPYEFQPWQADRGNELEEEARIKYEAKTFNLVQQVSLAVTDDGLFGASLDGLVDDDGSIEIKCFLNPEKLASILLDGDVGTVVDQMQGGMWITGRSWCDFVLYCPALKCIGKDITVIRFNRDEEYIHKLEQDLLEFNELVSTYIKKLKEV